MIKKFEQFVLEYYNKPSGESINESFQSRKLREIIRQHGKPKYKWEYKMLYDLKDDEIVDVLDSRDEYWKKYPSHHGESGKQATFMLELEDGAVIVISNLDILDSYWEKNKEEQKDEVFKKRHANRHKGNLGKHGGDDIHVKHEENVDKIKSRRLAEKLQPNIPEIIDEVKSIIRDIDIELGDGEKESDFIESEITLDGEKYTLVVNYEAYCEETSRSGGVAEVKVSINISDFDIWTEDGYTHTTNEDLGITYKTHKDLFYYEYEDDYIYDEAEAVGIDPSYFMSR